MLCFYIDEASLKGVKQEAKIMLQLPSRRTAHFGGIKKPIFWLEII